MSATVRLYSHAGLVTAHVNPSSGRYTTDSIGMLQMPYIARETITANTGTAQSTGADLTENRNARLIHVQIEPGKVVAIETNHSGRSVTADSNSPRYSGDVTIAAGQNWTFSILEIA